MEEQVVSSQSTQTQGEVVKFNNVPAIVMICVSVLFGGFIGIGFAIAALVTGSRVNDLYIAGNIEEAKRKLKLAKNFLLVTYIWDGIVGLFFIFYIIFIVLAVATL